MAAALPRMPGEVVSFAIVTQSAARAAEWPP